MKHIHSNYYQVNHVKQGLGYYFLWLWALLVTASIVLSPRLGDSGLFQFIRIDDVLFPFTATITLILIPKTRTISKIIFAFSALYLYNAIVLIVTHCSGFNSVSLIEKLLPFFKNIQYLVYFIFFFIFAYSSKSIQDYKRIILSIFICFIPNLFYGFYQIVTGNYYGYYGMGIINEISPTLTGTVFYIATIISTLLAHIETKLNTKFFWLFVAIINAIFTSITGSRGAFLASSVYFFVLGIYILVSIGKGIGKGSNASKITIDNTIIILILFSVILIILSIVSEDSLLSQIPNRASKLNITELPDEARVDNWSNVLSSYAEIVIQYPILALFGLGSGGIYEIFGMLLNAADSQLVYTVVSGGLIGSLLYVNALIQLYLFGRDKISISILPVKTIFVALFWSFMTFSISQEVFNLSKSGGLFWTICGLLIGNACNKYNFKN